MNSCLCNNYNGGNIGLCVLFFISPLLITLVFLQYEFICTGLILTFDRANLFFSISLFYKALPWGTFFPSLNHKVYNLLLSSKCPGGFSNLNVYLVFTFIDWIALCIPMNWLFFSHIFHLSFADITHQNSIILYVENCLPLLSYMWDMIFSLLYRNGAFEFAARFFTQKKNYIFITVFISLVYVRTQICMRTRAHKKPFLMHRILLPSTSMLTSLHAHLFG